MEDATHPKDLLEHVEELGFVKMSLGAGESPVVLL